MKYLFEEDGIRALEAFSFGTTLFAFDYDGTLARIVDDPVKAHMRKKTRELLNKLYQYAPVAVISGRQQSNVRELLNLDVDFVIGNHGLEGLPGGAATLSFAEDSSRKWRNALNAEIFSQDISIEDKKYSLAIHYRKVSDKKNAKAVIMEIASRLTPAPRIVLGKCVVNLIAPGAPHKGVALLELMLRGNCRSAVYFGDDDNDEDVFTLGDESILTVRVGSDPHSRALFFIENQDEIDPAISKCCEFLKSVKPKSRQHMLSDSV